MTARVGDVVEDAYGNPAIVVLAPAAPAALSVVQLAGSDYGRLASVDQHRSRPIVNVERVAWARARFDAIPEAQRTRIRAILGAVAR